MNKLKIKEIYKIWWKGLFGNNSYLGILTDINCYGELNFDNNFYINPNKLIKIEHFNKKEDSIKIDVSVENDVLPTP